jgi:hypothetical protein
MRFVLHRLRWWFLGLLALWVGAYVAHGKWLRERREAQPDLTLATCEKVKLGMCKDDIVVILGGPTGNHVRKPYWSRDAGVPNQGNWHKAKHFGQWTTMEGCLTVGFARDGTACYKEFKHVELARGPSWRECFQAGDLLGLLVKIFDD